MLLKNKIIEYGKKQSFQPSILSLFLNPFYFIRNGLYKGIKYQSHQLKGKLLDFGCGKKPYRNLFNVDEYIGLDIEVSGHSHIESEIDVLYDGKVIPFANDTFDSIFSTEVLEHVFNPDEVLKEIYRVMKPGGLGLITIPFMWGEHEIPFDYARYTSFGIAHLLKKNGFEIIQSNKTGHTSEVLFQLNNLYIFSFFKSKNRYMNTFFTILFLSPFNIIGVILTKILPRNQDLFHNNILLFKKK